MPRARAFEPTAGACALSADAGDPLIAMLLALQLARIDTAAVDAAARAAPQRHLQHGANARDHYVLGASLCASGQALAEVVAGGDDALNSNASWQLLNEAKVVLNVTQSRWGLVARRAGATVHLGLNTRGLNLGLNTSGAAARREKVARWATLLSARNRTQWYLEVAYLSSYHFVEAYGSFRLACAPSTACECYQVAPHPFPDVSTQHAERASLWTSTVIGVRAAPGRTVEACLERFEVHVRMLQDRKVKLLGVRLHVDVPIKWAFDNGRR